MNQCTYCMLHLTFTVHIMTITKMNAAYSMVLDYAGKSSTRQAIHTHIRYHRKLKVDCTMIIIIFIVINICIVIININYYYYFVKTKCTLWRSVFRGRSSNDQVHLIIGHKFICIIYFTVFKFIWLVPSKSKYVATK